jgi:RNA polymerase sigma-70 factor (ECF subfamily)
MSNTPTPVELLRLHQARIRRLAQRLAGRDPASDADDVLQDVHLAALERPPRALVALPAWISTTVRNLVAKRIRSKTRRDERERIASPRESQPQLSPADVVARVELEEFLLRCVRELPEPDRTIVVLRYFDERSATAIAQQLDLAQSTVRARLQRAIDQLRARLDAKSDDRKQWVAALAPWLAVAKSATPAASVALAAAAVVVLAAGGVVVTSMLLGHGRSKGSSVAEGATAVARSAEVAANADATSAPAAVEAKRAADPATTDASMKTIVRSTSPIDRPKFGVHVKLRPVDAVTRQPLVDASARISDGHESSATFGDGHHAEIEFVITRTPESGSRTTRWKLAVVAVGHDPDLRELEAVDVSDFDLGDVPLTRGSGGIEGHVRGAPSGGLVELRGYGRNRCPECWRRDEDGSCCGFRVDRSLVPVSSTGRFEFRSLAAGTYWLRVLDDKQRPVPTVRVELARGESKLVDLDLSSAVELTLESVDESGRPFCGAWARSVEPCPEVFHLEFDVDGVKLAEDFAPTLGDLVQRLGPAPTLDPLLATDAAPDPESGVVHTSDPVALFQLAGRGSSELQKWFNDGGRSEEPRGGDGDDLFPREHKVPGFAVVELCVRRVDANHWLFHDLPASHVKVRGSCGPFKADDLDLDLAQVQQRHVRVVFRAPTNGR